MRHFLWACSATALIAVLLAIGGYAQQDLSAPTRANSSEPPAPITVEIAHAVPAEYPATAVANRVEGTVSVSVVISPSGAVISTQAGDANPLLQRAAVEASKNYTFRARKGNEDVAVKCWAELAFDFKLPNQSATTQGPLLVSGNLIHADVFPDSIRVSEPVMKARVLRTVEPVYPRETVKAKVQGTVVLDLNVGSDGKVHDVRAISGPSQLSEPMVKAVRQWEFRPYQFLGQDINVETRFSRTIKLSVGPTTVVEAPDEAKALLSLNNPPGVKRGVCLQRTKASYPNKAKERGVQGPVLVAIVIAKDGTVSGAKAIGGNESLWEAAINAAKRWRYAPSTLNGTPVEVHDVITVQFE